ncbi:hypothetical protein [Mesorhizobium sp.]|uniref:hypothetical protein n=1 Tax=Mesorhizobium sp. TaxID=1871066 RepID=UPI0025FCA9AD|nr:hypothetical protein [Mesorhizobium sp.]
MPSYVKDAGVWKPESTWVRDAGVWKPAPSRYVKDAGVWKPVIEPAVLTYIGSNQNAADAASYNFAAQSIGVAAFDRLVIVAAASRATVNIAATALTIGGSPANIHANSTSGLGSAAIASLLVPAGTAADIGVAYSTTTRRCAISIYTLNKYLSATPTAAVAPAALGSTTTVTATLDVPAYGAALFLAGNGFPSPITWTDATENMDTSVEGVMQYSTAIRQPTADELAHNYTATWANADGGWIAGVAWR